MYASIFTFSISPQPRDRSYKICNPGPQNQNTEKIVK